jgi:hypothetical protein
MRSVLGAIALIAGVATIYAPGNALAQQIDIPTGVFVGLRGPDVGRGISSYENKHTTWAHNPMDGRLYSMGGDFISQAGAPDSYNQEQYSLSLAERWNDRANANAGWRQEYPYCGPDGGIQPKSPDFVGWTWDVNRRVFWMVPGTMVIPVAQVCSDRTVSTSDDPKYKFRHIMTYNPAEPVLARRWSDWGAVTAPTRGEGWMSVYDPVTDTIVRFAGDSSQRADIFNVQTRTWSVAAYGPNAVGGTVRIPEALSPDFVGRVIYVVDGTAGRLMRWNMDQRTLSDLGPVPDGPVTPISNAYSAWDSVNRVLLFFHFNTGRLHVYHPTTRTWETRPVVTDPPGLRPEVRHAIVFDPHQNVMAFLGNTNPNNNYIYLYRYANGSGDTTAPAVPANPRLQ